MEEDGVRYRIDRVTHTEKGFQDEMGFVATDSQPTLVDKVKVKVQRSCECSQDRVLSFFTGLFPIFSWIRHYQRKWIAGDIVSGITVGVVHIPQSMAFSILAGLAPVFGLYASFYPVLIYTLMGTSRHISVGTFAVTSLLTRSVVFRYYPPEDDVIIPDNGTILNSTVLPTMNQTEQSRFSDLDLKRAGVACAVSFLMGMFQLIFGLFRFGFITSYLSEPLIQGFTTGAAFQVATSQFPTALGLSIKPFDGPLAFIYVWIEIFKNVPNIHVATLVISIISFVFLTASREINMRFKDKMKIPIPSEVILVIIAILASTFGEFKKKYNVPIVDNIPIGLPPPVLPNMSILGEIVADGFALGVVGFATSVSIAKMYGIRKGYSINANQELLAYGASNLIPSFLLCFPTAAALARCEIQVNTGGNTQVVGILSVIIVLIVVLVLGPIFEPLPRSVLACIIIVGLFGIIAQLGNLKSVYKVSKIDFVVWIVTWLAVLILGVDLGLLTGVAFAIITVIVRTQLPRFEILINVDDTDIYRDAVKYKKDNITGIIIVKMHASLYYANKDYFRRKLISAVGFDPTEILLKKKQEEQEKEAANNVNNENGKSICCIGKRKDGKDKKWKQINKGQQTSETAIELADDSEIDEKKTEIFSVIVDCSSYGFIDFAGGKLLTNFAKEFNQLNIKFYLSNCNRGVREQLRRSGFMDVAGEDTILVSLHDAVLNAKHHKASINDSI